MFVIIFTAFLLIFILWSLFSYLKTRERLSKGVNMSLFLIKSPEDFIKETDFSAIFKRLHLQGWNRLLFGDPYIAFEKVVQAGKAQHYLAVPKNCEDLFEQNPNLSKSGSSAVPKDKFYAATYLTSLSKSTNFDAPKMNEEEGVVLQILARHSHKEKGTFDLNLELLSWASSKPRANKILGLKTHRLAVFDFFPRIFENNKRVKASFPELKRIFLN